MRKRVWIPAGLVAVVAVASSLFALQSWQALHAPMNIPAEGVWLEVPRGTPLRTISRNLAYSGSLTKPWLLSLYGRITGDATRVRAGEYLIPPGTTPATLLVKLVSGQVYLHQLTIVEGWRFTDLLTALRAHPAIVPGTADGPQIMIELDQPGVHPEGQFFPDTYLFPRGTLEMELLRTAHRALQQRLEGAWQNRSLPTQLQSPYEALILASIIEKETALASERRLISGVFHRRLERGMRLQTDPTVIYGVGEGYDGNLRQRDLTTDTPYNTYTRSGLPPTPIALPGGAALEAAIAPEVTEALYFVATGRPDGSHHFSATLEEHDRAVRDYLQRLRNSVE